MEEVTNYLDSDYLVAVLAVLRGKRTEVLEDGDSESFPAGNSGSEIHTPTMTGREVWICCLISIYRSKFQTNKSLAN